MTRLEEADLLVDVMALGGSRRADHDQSMRSIERGERLLVQRMTCREVVAVAEDGAQCLGDRARGRLAADKVLVDAKAFKRRDAATWPKPCRRGCRK